MSDNKTSTSADKKPVEEENSIAIVDETTIRDKIYIIRGVKVMLDFDLAKIYGYTTSAFNQQVNRNIDRFDNDFRFQLTREEAEELSMSQNVTSIQVKGVKGGRAKLPYAFTEQGIYMLMTVLKGELAVRQSKALIRTFRAMKDYIIENRNMVGQQEYLQLSIQVSDSLKEQAQMRGELNELGDQMKGVIDKLSNVVERSEISPFLLDLGKPVEKREYLLLNGQPLKAAETFIDIYSQAKKSIHIIDDYINIKTLRLLQDVTPGVTVTILSDNVRHQLHASDYEDFQKEFPGITITFLKTNKKTHDRYIILDYKTQNEKIYTCGASSKDAGNQITTITEMVDDLFKNAFNQMLKELLKDEPLVLK